MTIAEFCEGRNVDAQAIRKYIERHPEDFNGHTGKKGREITLDEIALEILEKKYPLPQLVQIIEDTESLKKLNKLQEEYIKLQNKWNEQSLLIAQAEAQKVLLEDKELQLQKEQERAEKLEQELARAKEENAKYKPSWFGFYKKVD